MTSACSSEFCRLKQQGLILVPLVHDQPSGKGKQLLCFFFFFSESLFPDQNTSAEASLQLPFTCAGSHFFPVTLWTCSLLVVWSLAWRGRQTHRIAEQGLSCIIKHVPQYPSSSPGPCFSPWPGKPSLQNLCGHHFLEVSHKYHLIGEILPHHLI